LSKNVISEQSYELLNIDNKISPLPMRRYTSTPATPPLLLHIYVIQQTTADSNKILQQQCIIYWNSKLTNFNS